MGISPAAAAVRPLYSGSGRTIPIHLTPALESEYQLLFAGLIVRMESLSEASAEVAAILSHQTRYSTVASCTGVPWWWIACIHQLESGADFHTHLHNGDPLSARTVHVPIGRPPVGNPPFQWEESAIDALQYEKLDQWHQWDVAGSLYRLESYNGFGYRRRGVHTPYLWAGSYWYVKGKYGADGVYDPTLVSHQIGAAVLLHRLVDTGVVSLPAVGTLPVSPV